MIYCFFRIHNLFIYYIKLGVMLIICLRSTLILIMHKYAISYCILNWHNLICPKYLIALSWRLSCKISNRITNRYHVLLWALNVILSKSLGWMANIKIIYNSLVLIKYLKFSIFIYQFWVFIWLKIVVLFLNFKYFILISHHILFYSIFNID